MQYNVGDMVRMNNLIGLITEIKNGRIFNGELIASHIKHYSVLWIGMPSQEEWIYCEADVNELFIKENP